MHQRMEMAVRAELLLPEDWKPRIHSTLRPNDELRERIYADAVRGATSHAHSNSFFVHDDMNDFERIDYIMYQPTTGLQCLHSRLTFLSLLPDIKCSYSDHYGMMAQFQITTVSSDKPAEKAEGREFAAIGSDIKNQVGAASAAVDSQISIDAPKSKLYLDVCEADLLPAMICVLTQGVKNARYRISLYTVQSFLYGLLWGAWNGRFEYIIYQITKSPKFNDSLTARYGDLYGGAISNQFTATSSVRRRNGSAIVDCNFNLRSNLAAVLCLGHVSICAAGRAGGVGEDSQ